MHTNESAENYLETILILSKSHPVVRSVDVAAELGFKKSSVSVAMKKLRETDQITVSPEGYLYLTESGLATAEKIYERHLFLSEWLEKLGVNPVVAARRGKGFMQGLVIEGTTVGSVVTKALANGLLVISAGSDVLRLVPPLVITKEHIDEMIEKLEKSLA